MGLGRMAVPIVLNIGFRIDHADIAAAVHQEIQQVDAVRFPHMLDAISDYDEVKRDAQAIYLAGSRKEAQAACRCFAARWRKSYPTVVRQLQRDLPELLSFFNFPQHLWRKLRTTNIIERCFVEVRRRTRPMVCFVNVESVDRIIYSIFQRFNLDWKNRTLKLFTQAA